MQDWPEAAFETVERRTTFSELAEDRPNDDVSYVLAWEENASVPFHGLIAQHANYMESGPPTWRFKLLVEAYWQLERMGEPTTYIVILSGFRGSV